MALTLTLSPSSTTNPSLLPRINTCQTCLQLRLQNKPFRCMLSSLNSCKDKNKKKSLLTCRHSKPHVSQQHDQHPRIGGSINQQFSIDKSSLAAQLGVLLATVAQPAFAVTGVNNEEDFTWILIQLGIVAFWYFLIMPPIIMNWLRIRWYKRNLLEMYLQFMFVFMFFPGVLLWAPFLNFRKFPRDPSMKDPWSTPEDPSQVKNAFLKYPFAKPEDYE